MNVTLHVAVSLQVAECLREDPLGNVADAALELHEAQTSPSEHEQHQKAPFVAHSIEHVPDGALIMTDEVRSGYFGHTW